LAPWFFDLKSESGYLEPAKGDVFFDADALDLVVHPSSSQAADSSAIEGTRMGEPILRDRPREVEAP
jgi:hypothetical protein